MSHLNHFAVYVLNQAGERVGQVDDYVSLKAKRIFNDVGTWTMEISRSTNKLIELTTPMYGLDVHNTHTGTSFITGLIDTRRQEYDPDTDLLTITGWDENKWLDFRLAHPSPTESFPPYVVQAADVRTGVASTIICQYINYNLGPNAISTRKITTLPAIDAATGSTVTGRAQWQPLIDLVQELALVGGDLGFRAYRSGTQVQFETYAPVDRTQEVKFSVSLGNVMGSVIETQSPKATYVFAAGSGDGTARVYQEVTDGGAYATWGRREYFHDAASITTAAELAQAGRKALVDNQETANFGIQVMDSHTLEYGEAYNLGDRATAIFTDGTGEVQEIIREVGLELGEVARITPVIGTPDRRQVFQIFREIRRLRSELRKRQVS